MPRLGYWTTHGQHTVRVSQLLLVPLALATNSMPNFQWGDCVDGVISELLALGARIDTAAVMTLSNYTGYPRLYVTSAHETTRRIVCAHQARRAG